MKETWSTYSSHREYLQICGKTFVNIITGYLAKILSNLSILQISIHSGSTLLRDLHGSPINSSRTGQLPLWVILPVKTGRGGHMPKGATPENQAVLSLPGTLLKHATDTLEIGEPAI